MKTKRAEPVVCQTNRPQKTSILAHIVARRRVIFNRVRNAVLKASFVASFIGMIYAALAIEALKYESLILFAIMASWFLAFGYANQGLWVFKEDKK